MRYWELFGIAAILTLQPNQAVAENAAAKAENEFNNGVKQLRTGKNQEALISFKKALRINPENQNPICYISTCHRRLGNYEDCVQSARDCLKTVSESEFRFQALRDMGLCQYELGNWMESITIIDRYIDEEKNIKMRNLLEEKVIEMLPRVNLGTLRLKVSPEETNVWVNDKSIPSRRFDRLRLPAGTSTVKLRASGFRNKTQQVQMLSGDIQELTIELVPRRWYERWWFWTTVGAVLVGGGVLAGFLIADHVGAPDGVGVNMP